MKQQVDGHQDAAHPTAQRRQRCSGIPAQSLVAALFLVMAMGAAQNAMALSGYIGATGLNTNEPLTVNTFPVDSAQTQDTGVSLVAFPGETAVEKMKFYCDQRFDSAETALACAQQPNDQLAIQVPSANGISLDDETNTQVPFMTVGAVTTFTTPEGLRGSLLCETAGDGSGNNYCVKITEASTLSIPAAGSGPTVTNGALTLPKFVVENNATECGDDLLKMQEFAGQSAQVDWTSNRFAGDVNNINDLVRRQLRINICINALVQFVDSPSASLPIANAYEIKQVARSMAFTPIKCTYSGKTYKYLTPPVYSCP